MPLYEFRCPGCLAEEEAIVPISQRDTVRIHSCGRPMQRVVSLPQPPIVRFSSREKILQTLNKEGDTDFPGGAKHRPRYERAMARDLDRPKVVIGKGF